MTLLLITGAGASRSLGQPDDPLPLMPDWANALCTALDANETGLAGACGLTTGMDGEAFEEAIGALLEWQRIRPLDKRFTGLGGEHAGAEHQQVTAARDRGDERLQRIMSVINHTLYEQFGQERVNDERAEAAYGNLLKHFDVRQLIVATTNYDRAGEAALRLLGRNPDTGFPGSLDRTPTLDVRGLIKRGSEDMTPYLHLHGSVGWYERGGTVYDDRGDQPFNPTHGTPVVLYPDPAKDPTNSAVVSDLWREFDIALSMADHVLVVGHSLHDPALVRAINEAEPRKLAVTHYFDNEAKRIKKQLPKAIPMKMDFDPDLEVDMAAVAAFRG